MNNTQALASVKTPRYSSAKKENPHFNLGVTRYFGLGDLNDRYFLSGWAVPEENHSWNDGIEASFIVTLENRPSQTCLIKVTGLPYLTLNLVKQDVFVFANGHRIAFWRLNTPQTYSLVAEIEPEYWIEKNGIAVAKLDWHMPDSATPRQAAGINDERQLGFCFQDITIALKSE